MSIEQFFYFVLLPLAALTAIVHNVAAFKLRVPFVATDRKLWPLIKDNLKIKKNVVIYDLGSGTGSMLFSFLKFQPKQVIGYELSPWPYLISKVKQLFYINKPVKNLFSRFFKG